jgi:hypothetical protein
VTEDIKDRTGKDNRQGGIAMRDAWDRAVAAEKRRCDRLGFVFRQPGLGRRQDTYGADDLVELANVNCAIATYRGGPRGRATGTRAPE